MKRYWLFEFSEYCPSGGFDDFVDSFDTFEEAVVAAKSEYGRLYAHVVDSQTGERTDCP